MNIDNRLDIIAHSKSIGFDPTNNNDLVCEYLFLRSIYSWKGLKIGSEAVCKSDNFLKMRARYQLVFFTEDQESDPAFWSEVDALLMLFYSNNLFDFENFQRIFSPWMIADQAAFDAAFPAQTSFGKKVGALALILRFVNLHVDPDNIFSIDPMHFFDGTPDLNTIWTTATGLSRQSFFPVGQLFSRTDTYQFRSKLVV